MSGDRRAAARRDLVGRDLGDYEVRRHLGSGGMGEVYCAHDRRLNRDVALKILPEALAAEPDRVRRFQKEARAVSALNHPNIVTVYEIGSSGSLSYIAMELVEGKTLRELLAAGPLPMKRLLELALQITDGLARAHEAGIIHRDLKPENIMVTRDGLAKILDFGLAKRLPFESSEASGAPGTTLTEEGFIVGTVGYMSPEQASGRTIDFRSDQFTFGSILYEMVSGRRAFDRPSKAEALAAIIRDEPDRTPLVDPSLPAPLRWILDRCLAKDPKDRYACTRDLASELKTIRDRRSELPGAAVEKSRRFPRAAAAAILAAAAIAALAFFAGQRSEDRRARDAPAPKRTTLTFRRGFLTGARFASDGQTIVYSAEWDGKRSEIFTTRVGSTESRPLGMENATILAVSSKGELAVLINCDRRGPACKGMLARVPLAGGAPRDVLGGVASADWSPDGRVLAVAIWGRIEYPLGKVLYQSEGRGFVSSVRVSPDGNFVAFLDHPSRDSARGVLSVVDRAGKKTVLTNQWARQGPILWSPSGDEVFFTPLGGGERRGARLSGRTRSAAWIPGLDDVSKDGRFLDTGMQSENYRGVILARVPEESEELNLSWQERSVAADLSKDGRTLLLYEERFNPLAPEEETFTTFLRPTDGSDAMMLGDGKALALSPDGQWALAARTSPETHLVLLPTGAGEPRRLAGGGLLYRRASFFPDGKRILFTTDDPKGERHSFVQEIAGGPPKPIGQAGFRAMVISPDGQSVAGLIGGGLLLYRVGEDGRPRPIPGPAAALVQWSADGKTIYLRGEEDGTLTLSRLDLATGRRELWKQLAPRDPAGFLRYGPGIQGPGYSITPDGRYYAYTYFTDQSRLILAEAGPNWWR